MHVVNGGKMKGAKRARASVAQLARLSEAAVLERARTRDVAAFEDLVRRTEQPLYRLAMRYVHNEGDAQEILQNAYLSAWRRLPKFEGRAQFGCWMYRITVNASLMFLRARNRHPAVPIDDIEPEVLNDALGQGARMSEAQRNRPQRPDEEYQSVELRRAIQVAVNSLPQSLRDIFLLRDVRELSTEDTAGKLGLSKPAAKTRLHRARLALRESLVNYVSC